MCGELSKKGRERGIKVGLRKRRVEEEGGREEGKEGGATFVRTLALCMYTLHLLPPLHLLPSSLPPSLSPPLTL